MTSPAQIAEGLKEAAKEALKDARLPKPRGRLLRLADDVSVFVTSDLTRPGSSSLADLTECRRMC